MQVANSHVMTNAQVGSQWNYACTVLQLFRPMVNLKSFVTHTGSYQALLSNMLSASSNSHIAEDYIQSERLARRMVGHMQSNKLTAVIHTSPLRVILKKHAEKWHLIVGLSASTMQSAR